VRQLSRVPAVRDGRDELSALFVETSGNSEAPDLPLFVCGAGVDDRS
jgi:hypothetical protein